MELYENLYSISEDKRFDVGDHLFSIRHLNENFSYNEDVDFSVYFIFKAVAFACLKQANLGLYANLFDIDKHRTLPRKEFSILSNGFLRSKNLLDILRFESSYETILNKEYRLFHDSYTENIDRVISKNEKVFDLIEQRIVGERLKQGKILGDVISYGLAIISILTIGVAAADITNFFGLNSLLGSYSKLLIITVPILTFACFVLFIFTRITKSDRK